MDDIQIHAILQKYKACRSLREINAIKEILLEQKVETMREANRILEESIKIFVDKMNYIIEKDLIGVHSI